MGSCLPTARWVAQQGTGARYGVLRIDGESQVWYSADGVNWAKRGAAVDPSLGCHPVVAGDLAAEDAAYFDVFGVGVVALALCWAGLRALLR